MNIITFESVEAFVNRCLKYAESMPDSVNRVNRFEAQAFGAVMFANEIVWQNDPALEKRLIEKWESEWKPAFEGLY